jgi:hypothetical protein
MKKRRPTWEPCEFCGRLTSGKTSDGIVVCSRDPCLVRLDEENDHRQAWKRRIISEWPIKVILRALDGATRTDDDGMRIEIEDGPTLPVDESDLRAELTRRTDGLLN